MDPPETSGPGLTELEHLALNFASLDPGLTKRGKPRKRRSLAALARAHGVGEHVLQDAYRRGMAKMRNVPPAP